eukprot:scaffold18433_cov28-Prasinocladus_malaysianus.AAC.1
MALHAEVIAIAQMTNVAVLNLDQQRQLNLKKMISSALTESTTTSIDVPEQATAASCMQWTEKNDRCNALGN